MEEAYLTNSATVATGFTDRAATACAATLDEAWAWGFDVGAWRAHLGPATWPEVLRQFAVASGDITDHGRDCASRRQPAQLAVMQS